MKLAICQVFCLWAVLHLIAAVILFFAAIELKNPFYFAAFFSSGILAFSFYWIGDAGIKEIYRDRPRI